MTKKMLLMLLTVVLSLWLYYVLSFTPERKAFHETRSYEPVSNWPNLPPGVHLGNPTGIGIDTSQNLVVFHRAERTWPLFGAFPSDPIPGKTILVIDKDHGTLLDSWGDNLFIMPHGLTVDRQNNIWVTDVGLNQVFKFSHAGKLLMKLGEAGVAGNDAGHFNQPTDIAIAEDGSFYVSDGYGNSRVIKFSAAGKYMFEWGKKGNKKGQFNIPHGITIGEDQQVYVADRENNRIQVFDQNGKFLQQITAGSVGAVCAVAFGKSASTLYAVDDLTFLKLKHRGSDILVFNQSGQLQSRFGRSGFYEGKTSWYHDLAIDQDDNIYVGDILGNRVQKLRKLGRQ